MAVPLTPTESGWYDVPDGPRRWWDGEAWGPTAPPERWAAVLSHCGLLLLYVVGPLVMRETIGQHDPFVRKHATEGLNAQITFGIAWNAFALAGWALAEATGNKGWFVLWAGMALAFLWIVWTSILGARRAGRGEPWRYPGSLRLVPGGWLRERVSPQ